MRFLHRLSRRDIVGAGGSADAGFVRIIFAVRHLSDPWLYLPSAGSSGRLDLAGHRAGGLGAKAEVTPALPNRLAEKSDFGPPGISPAPRVFCVVGQRYLEEAAGDHRDGRLHTLGHR